VGFQDRALADLITIEAAGTISIIRAQSTDEATDLSDAFDAILPFNEGTSFTASVVYDLSVPDDWDADPEVGVYDYATFVEHFIWDIDGTTFLEEIWGWHAVRVHDDTPSPNPEYPYDWFVTGAWVNLPDGWGPDSLIENMRLQLTDRDSSVFSSDALPTDLNLDDFEVKYIELRTWGNREGVFVTPLGSLEGEDFRIVGTIETLSTFRTSTEPIPEPATMLLLGSGLISLAGFRRRFRKK
jgi:hypothetical protein